MKLSDFRNLDRNNIGAWPQGVKLTFCVILFALVMLAGWYLFITDRQDDLERKQNQEQTLRKEFSDKQAKAVNLKNLRDQLQEMRDMLAQLIHQLPTSTQMPQLLIDISQAALSTGLETQLFKPGAETVKEGFYAEKPIQLRMLGTYHQFGNFISSVAAIPRVVILTMQDVSLTPSNDKTAAAGGRLLLEGTVRTYHSIEDDGLGNAPAPAPKQGGK
jgi:type IV pilus assembly protein PilO